MINEVLRTKFRIHRILNGAKTDAEIFDENYPSDDEMLAIIEKGVQR